MRSIAESIARTEKLRTLSDLHHLVRGFTRVRKVSKHLQLFLRKCGLYQLTDYAYDMSISIFCNYSVTMLLNKLLRCIIRYGTPIRAVVMAMGLIYRLHIMVKSVLYGAFDLLVS